MTEKKYECNSPVRCWYKMMGGFPDVCRAKRDGGEGKEACEYLKELQQQKER